MMVLSTTRPLRWVHASSSTITPMSNAPYTMVPVLNGRPKELTKSSSKLPATFTMPGMMMAWMTPRITAPTTMVYKMPKAVGLYLRK